MYNGLSQVYCIKPEGKSISIQMVNNLTPLDMYNGLSQSYCIKPDGRNH